MVNIVDLYALFGELAGLDDVQAEVPRPIDAMPMLPYVREPAHPGIRLWNYSEVGTNLQALGAVNPPCVIGGTCTQIPVTKSVCEDNNGVWWGAGADDPSTAGIPAGGYQYCCQVNAFLAQAGQDPLYIAPLSSAAIRNDRYKLVENSGKNYVSAEEPCVDQTEVELYEIDQAVPEPELDESGLALPLDELTAEQQRNYNVLAKQLAVLRASQPACPGDGNIDLRVDARDLADWKRYAEGSDQSSVYDLNIDGLTDEADQAIIQQNLGLECRPPAPTPSPAPTGGPAASTPTPAP
jgi:hypothetical protein